MGVDTLELHSFCFAVVFDGIHVVGRERRPLEASLVISFGGFLWGRRRYLGARLVLFVVFYGACVVWRERRHLEASLFIYSGGLLGLLRHRARAYVL